MAGPQQFLRDSAYRFAQGFQHGSVRAETRGPADDLDALFPLEDFSFAGATTWLNSPPLTGIGLRGRVVLINFWTYSSVNCLRALPFIRGWVDSYSSHGLAVIGVHSPEYSFEQDVDNVRLQLGLREIGYPVAIDNNYSLWRSFHNEYWPAFFVADATGKIRHHSFGEGHYEETDSVLRQLLREAGAAHLPAPVEPAAVGVEEAADWAHLRTAETHTGYGRQRGFASAGGIVRDEPADYEIPMQLRLGHWALGGTWTVDNESATPAAPGGRLSFRFHARALNIVAAPPDRTSATQYRVTLDGHPPADDRGAHVDEAGRGRVGEAGVYELIRRSGQVHDSTVDIEFAAPGVSIYAVTFG